VKSGQVQAAKYQKRRKIPIKEREYYFVEKIGDTVADIAYKKNIPLLTEEAILNSVPRKIKRKASKRDKLRQTRKHNPVYCKQCGTAELPTVNHKKYCSEKCAHKGNRKVERPNAKNLEKLVWSVPMLQLAHRFGVSDVALKKWCTQAGIETPPRGYWMKQQAAKQDRIKPSRNKLAMLVWKYSVPRIAKHYGVGYNVVRRWCTEYTLETPPVGYWAKHENDSRSSQFKPGRSHKGVSNDHKF
jgi:hypothetical protein